MNPVTNNEEHRRISEQFASASSGTPTVNLTTGSTQRKRSRITEENTFVREGHSKKESTAKKVQINALMHQLHQQIEQVFLKGEMGKTIINRLTILKTFRNLGLEVFPLLSKIINLQEDRAAAHEQVAHLQLQNNVSASTTAAPYMRALMQALNVVSGRVSPPVNIPTGLRHAPAERVVIFKSQLKGVQATKEEQRSFRQDVKNVIGNELMNDVNVIRPTRNGGHTLIFQTAAAREEAVRIFRANERKADPPIEEEHSCIVAPKKKVAKIVCRDPPDDISPASVIDDMYDKRNAQLLLIPLELREATIVQTKFGWIFELSSIEAAATQAQDGRIRFGIAREMKVEEYIPIQQCYNCCNFGHSAKFCRMEVPCCRLCGTVGHAVWICPHKDDKTQWRCANCMIQNQTKGMAYPTDHGAAQFHKCPCAKHHKDMRKAQLVAAGIYTVPEGSNAQKDRGPINAAMTRATNGSQINTQNNIRKKSRSRFAYKKQHGIQTMTSTSSSANFSSSSNSSSSSNYIPHSSSSSTFSSPLTSSSSQHQLGNEIATYRTKMTKVQRPQSFDGWKQVGRKSDNEGSGEVRGRDFSYQVQGTNSTSQLKMVDIDVLRPSSSQSLLYDE